MEITDNSAKSGGTVSGDNIGTITARGVCWNTTGNPTLEDNDGHTNDGTGTGSFTSSIIGLTEKTTYYLAAYATNEEGTAYGQIKQFTTPIPCGQLTIDYHGQTYHTVKIGDQCWMKENLNYETGNSWCYDNNAANCNAYGRLYDWLTIMNGASSSDEVPSGVQGICPEGWHIPSDAEWKILEGNADTQYGVGDSEWNATGLRGYDAGKRLKSTNGWCSGGNGTDIFGFSALPGGYRGAIGSFSSLGDNGVWWSATESDSTSAWYRYLDYHGGGVIRLDSDKEDGFSVRCVRD